MAAAQKIDFACSAFPTAITGLKLQQIQYSEGPDTLLCDVSMGKPRPVIPANWQRKVEATPLESPIRAAAPAQAGYQSQWSW